MHLEDSNGNNVTFEFKLLGEAMSVGNDECTEVKVTNDSGAADNVGPMGMAEWIPLKETRASRAGTFGGTFAGINC